MRKLQPNRYFNCHVNEIIAKINKASDYKHLTKQEEK